MRYHYNHNFETVEKAIEFQEQEYKNFPIGGYNTDLNVVPEKDGTFSVRGSRCGSCG